MASENHSSGATGENSSEDSLVIAANIERYLNNHTREGSHAWQMNMAARPETWHPLGEAPPSGAQLRVADTKRVGTPSPSD